MPELRLGTVRHIGPYNQIPIAFEQLGQRLGPAAAVIRERGTSMIAIYHDDPESVSPDQLRSDAAVVVPADLVLPDGVVEQRVPAGRYACALHVGPYEQLGDAWARFMGEWVPASGYRIAPSPCYEIYLNDPAATPKASLRTEMYIPLA
jgi:AraC family transcriptional regulator